MPNTPIINVGMLSQTQDGSSQNESPASTFRRNTSWSVAACRRRSTQAQPPSSQHMTLSSGQNGLHTDPPSRNCNANTSSGYSSNTPSATDYLDDRLNMYSQRLIDMERTMNMRLNDVERRMNITEKNVHTIMSSIRKSDELNKRTREIVKLNLEKKKEELEAKNQKITHIMIHRAMKDVLKGGYPIQLLRHPPMVFEICEGEDEQNLDSSDTPQIVKIKGLTHKSFGFKSLTKDYQQETIKKVFNSLEASQKTEYLSQYNDEQQAATTIIDVIRREFNSHINNAKKHVLLFDEKRQAEIEQLNLKSRSNITPSLHREYCSKVQGLLSSSGMKIQGGNLVIETFPLKREEKINLNIIFSDTKAPKLQNSESTHQFTIDLIKKYFEEHSPSKRRKIDEEIVEVGEEVSGNGNISNLF